MISTLFLSHLWFTDWFLITHTLPTPENDRHEYSYICTNNHRPPWQFDACKVNYNQSIFACSFYCYINFKENYNKWWIFSLSKNFKMTSANWQPFCLGCNVLTGYDNIKFPFTDVHMTYYCDICPREQIVSFLLHYIIRLYWSMTILSWANNMNRWSNTSHRIGRRQWLRWKLSGLVKILWSVFVPKKHVIYKSNQHYNDLTMSAMTSQIISLTIVYSSVYSGTDKRKHQSSASLAFVREIHRSPVNFPHKGPVKRKMCPFDDVIMKRWWEITLQYSVGKCWRFSTYQIPSVFIIFYFIQTHLKIITIIQQVILVKPAYKTNVRNILYLYYLYVSITDEVVILHYRLCRNIIHIHTMTGDTHLPLQGFYYDVLL